MWGARERSLIFMLIDAPKDIIFLHQSAPAQFVHLIRHLSTRKDFRIIVIGMQGHVSDRDICQLRANGIKLLLYKPKRGNFKNLPGYLNGLDSKVLRAMAVYELLLHHVVKLKSIKPALIWAHPGWGETLFLRQLLPEVPQVHYAEYYYRIGNDSSYAQCSIDLPSGDHIAQVLTKNLINDQSIISADILLAPTYWQMNTYPSVSHGKFKVIHDGIDIHQIHGNMSTHPGTYSSVAHILDCDIPFVVYINRTLEDIRGASVFLEAAECLLSNNPQFNIVVIGSNKNGGSYGPKEQRNAIYARYAALSTRYPERFFMLQFLEHSEYHYLLSKSCCNIYLTSPFVLSWSLLELMAVGSPIVASNTAPVVEFLNEAMAILVDYPNSNDLAESILKALGLSSKRKSIMKENMYNAVKERACLANACLPRQLALIESLLK